MQLKALISFALVGLAWSTPTLNERASLTERDLATVTSAINSVNSALQSLDSTIKNFQGSGDVTGLQQQSQDTIDTMNQAASDVSGSDTLSLTDALQIQTVAQTLTGTVNTTVDDLIAKKDVIDQAGAGAKVLSQLQAQQTAGQKLSDAIVSKVPDSVQSIASSLTGSVSDSINRAVQAYQGDTSGASSSTAASSAPAATSAPATTSAPAATTTAAGSSDPCPAAETSSAASSPTTAAGNGTSGGGGTTSDQCPCLSQLGQALTGSLQKRNVELGQMLDERLERLDNIGRMLMKRYLPELEE